MMWLIAGLVCLVVGIFSMPLDARLPKAWRGRLNRASLPLLLLSIAIFAYADHRREAAWAAENEVWAARAGTDASLIILAADVRQQVRFGDRRGGEPLDLERVVETQELPGDPPRTVDLLRSRFEALVVTDDRGREALAAQLAERVADGLEPDHADRAQEVLQQITATRP